MDFLLLVLGAEEFPSVPEPSNALIPLPPGQPDGDDGDGGDDDDDDDEEDQDEMEESDDGSGNETEMVVLDPDHVSGSYCLFNKKYLCPSTVYCS